LVLLTDKSSSSIVLNADTYHAKMSSPTETAPYQLTKRDLTNHLSHKLSKKLFNLSDKGRHQRLLASRSDLAQTTT